MVSTKRIPTHHTPGALDPRPCHPISSRRFPGAAIARTLTGLAAAIALPLLSACSPMLAGQVAEAGYNAAKTSFGSLSPTAAGADERQKRMQGALNDAEVGEDVKPLLDAMGEPPREKSANARGFTCYEYPGVYSSEEAAVIVAKGGKIVFFGNSRCNAEMQEANFRGDGKYAGATTTGAAPSTGNDVSAVPGGPAPDAPEAS